MGEEPFFLEKEGFAALNRRMLPAGRLLVSCCTSGSLNRPLAAPTSGARAPSEESRFAAFFAENFEKAIDKTNTSYYDVLH